MTRNEITKAIKTYLEYYDGDANAYCEEMTDTAMYLRKHYHVIPEALPRLAVDIQWTLQHNVDSYGCDYDWVYNTDPKSGGMKFIIEDQCCIPNWAKDKAVFDLDFEPYL